MQTSDFSSAAVWLSVLAVVGMVSPQPLAAQFPDEHVSLYGWLDLGTFGAGSGNDCWGYTSPSGREYALMGLNNQVAFVEITNPANPNWFHSIRHRNSTWGDIKVYRNVAYVVTEASDTGIQVIDMSLIDQHIVTLVNTIPLPDRSHNIAVDVESGYLYTCGSRGGSATTVIFDLSNPVNPVEVGTWNGAYEHDAQIVTYTSGPYAGRQIMFGASTGRGLDIIDVTDKANTFLISRTSYPNVAYCHQVWTEDLQHLYVNDEQDSLARTTVFDITDLANPVLLGEFGSGRTAIDHNLYVKDGFIFEANYKSGLRVFDANVDPISPQQVGWFDTYPEADSLGFDGAWSCYPFFPSGTVIVSDINRGLFILDPSGALGEEPVYSTDDPLLAADDGLGGDYNRVGDFKMPTSAAAGGQEVAIRVKLNRMYIDLDEDPANGCPVRTGLPDLQAFEGQVRYLGPPEVFDNNALSDLKWVGAKLQCAPFYRDWSATALRADFPDRCGHHRSNVRCSADAECRPGGACEPDDCVNHSICVSVLVDTIYYHGAEVVPCSIHSVQQATQACLESANPEDCFSDPLEVRTALWGDIWPPFGDVSFTDIGKIVDAFKSIPFVPGDPPEGGPRKVRAMLREDNAPFGSKINFTDIGRVVDAFKTIAYPEDGPIDCP